MRCSGLLVIAGFIATLTAGVCGAESPLLALPAASLPVSTLAPTTKAATEARRILPNVPLFRTVADQSAAIGDEAGTRAYPNSLRLELAPGVAFDGQVYRVERSDNGAISLSMKLAGQPLGFAVLTELDGRVHGMVMMPGGRWQVKSVDDGSQVVEKLDDAAFPPDGQPLGVHGAPPHAGSAGDGPLASAGSTNQWLIDVMIVWDAAAQAAAGADAAGMQTMAANAVAIANTTYANSGIAQRLRLVYSGAVTYTERTTCPGGGDHFDCALDDITNDFITAPATLSSLRATHGADLVTLLIADHSFCGIAWLPDTISSANNGYGFSVVSQSCAVSNLSYPHELGHNMGANHDVANAPVHQGPKPYNYGSYNAVNKWRTVMAYPSPCSNDFSCARLPFFSNPDYAVDYDGAGGEPAITLGTASTQNNAMVLNLTAKAIAAYSDTSALHPVPASFTDVPVGDSQFGAVEFLKQSQITSGCTASTYCVGNPITRRQMAVFLERARKSSVYTPPAATGIFIDVPAASQFADYIEALKADGITQGCTANQFCPDDSVSRAQMALFVLRASCGPAYVPAAATGTIFADVTTATSGAAFIEKLYRSGVTQGCGLSPLSYCPNDSLTRGQMAVFMERTFPLLTPSEACTP